MTLRRLLAFSVLLICFAYDQADAAKTYTPQQLKKMIAKGKYPREVTKSRKEFDFDLEKCKVAAETINSKMVDYYPVKVLKDDLDKYVAKAWTNDGSVLIECIDGKTIMTETSYID